MESGRYYTLGIANVSEEKNLRIIQELRNESEDAYNAISNIGLALCRIAWYTHTQDMKKFSQRYPNVLFILSGEGEEQGDVWKEYHQNGKVQIVYPDLVWPEFDPEKLR